MRSHIIRLILLAELLLLGSLFFAPSNRVSAENPQTLATHEISLSNRWSNQWVNDVFKDNILLTLKYLNNEINRGQAINWQQVNQPATYSFPLNPGETFAFHDDILPEYRGKIVKTTNSHFSFSEGFRSDGYLFGDGVCHLASLLYWTARDAKLFAVAPTSHNFALIQEIPKEYGVSIYNSFSDKGVNARQNLYITNSSNRTIVFMITYNGKTLTSRVIQE